jgi:hypothetical protein
MSCSVKRLPKFKKGNTFLAACTYKELGIVTSVADIDIYSQVRDEFGLLVCSLNVEKANQITNKGVFYLRTSHTSNWPEGNLACDIRFENTGNIRSTQTFFIPVIDEITK